MSPGAPTDYWRIVLTHEAGHAVAVRAIFGATADIFVKGSETQPNQIGASYGYKTDTKRAWFDEASAVDSIMTYAAGAKAEEICLGITESKGFGTDLACIKSIRRAWEQRCDVKNWASWPEEMREAALENLPQWQATLTEVVKEIESNFERTATLISRYLEVLEMIAAEAYRNANEVGAQKLRPGQILLSAKRIEEIWNNTEGR